MSTFRERLANLIGGDVRVQEIERLQRFNELLSRARDYTYSRESLQQQLSELDPQLMDMLLRQRNLVPLIGEYANGVAWSESDRRTAVNDSRYMHHYDVMTSRAVSLWTDFGFGQHVQIKPKDEGLAEVFTECWTARRNRPLFGQRKLHELSNNLMVDGEYLLLAYVSTLDGQVTFRRLPTEKISEIVHEEDDPDIPLWYVQNTDTTKGRIYYADWVATPEQLEKSPVPVGSTNADDLRPDTKVVAMHVAIGEYKGRGWPQLYRALDWARAYRNFLQDRASIAAAVALYVDKVKVTGNQQALNAMKASLESTLALSTGAFDRNPSPPAGSTWLENQSVDRQRMPMSTGAGDAQTDGMTIAAQFASGAGVPLHFLNRPDSMQNRAVARESGLPWYKQIQRYQSFWLDVFSDAVELVGRMANEYGEADIEDFSTEVILDSPFDSDIAETVSLMASITGAVAGGAIDAGVARLANERLVMLALTALGVRDVNSILNPETALAAVPEAVERAFENLRQKKITTQQFAEFMRLESENGNGNGHHA